MKYFVTRHQGAVTWAKKHNLSIDEFVEHLDISKIGRGDEVYGTLPINLAEEVCVKGAKYFHLTLNVPPDLRGNELSAEQLVECGAKIQEYIVRRVVS